MSFRFRKIYADLVTADGTVCIAYFAWLEVCRVRSAFAGVELYFSDGRREVLRALPPATQTVPGDTRPVELRLNFPYGALTLRYESLQGPWIPRGQNPSASLEWSVRVPHADVAASWSGDIARPDMNGTGYIDLVDLRRPTRWCGVRDLEWGRVHLTDCSVVFVGIRSPGGTPWRRVALWHHGAGTALELDRFQLEQRNGNFQLGFPARDSPLAAVELRPVRVLHEGLAVDRARLPGFIERLGLRLISGRTNETRWLSRAQPADRDTSRSGFALHEVVRFGGR